MITKKGLQRIGILLLAVLTAMLAGAVIILLSGANPLTAYYSMLVKPMTSLGNIGGVFIHFIPLLLIGIGVSFTFHAKLNNLGGQGQMLMGALGMTLIGIPPIGEALGAFSLPVGFLVAMIFGAFWAAIAGFMKTRFGASEIVVTLMLNYIAVQAINYILFYHLRTDGEIRSPRIVKMLPKLFEGTRITWGVVIALVLVVVYAIVMAKTKFGFNLRTVGGSIKAAKYSGINTKLYYFLSMAISGAFCGIAGAAQISGNTRRLTESTAGDYGFSGIVVAMLGSLHPVGLVIASFLMALLTSGSSMMQTDTGIPESFTQVLQALIVLFILMGMAISDGKVKRRKGGKEK
ncbi:MAG: ABC transporter permease [Lachnospiraceae bacterium]|nr:ABC transporter permease [Lachnospiraceae bacterium]